MTIAGAIQFAVGTCSHHHYCVGANVFRVQSNVLALKKKRQQRTYEYRSYRLIHKSERYNDNVSSEKQKKKKTVTVQVKEQTFNRKDSIYVIRFLTEFQ